MQFNLLPAFFIFLGSYFPLAIILTIQDIPSSWWDLALCNRTIFVAGNCRFVPFDHPLMGLLFLLMSGGAVYLAWVTLRKISFPFQIDVKRAKATPNEIINYTFPYVVSFMGITYGETQKMLGFFVFLIWMFAITYKSGQILMNPLLLIFGWRLYEATIVINGVEKDIRVLKKEGLPQGTLEAQTIQDFYIIKG